MLICIILLIVVFPTWCACILASMCDDSMNLDIIAEVKKG